MARPLVTLDQQVREVLYEMQTAIGSLASPKISAVVQSQQQSFGPLKDGFTLAKTLSIQRLEIETDVTMTVSLMNQHTHITHPFYSIIFYCKLLMHGFLKTKLSHVFRKANQCADIWRKMKVMLYLPPFLFCTLFPPLPPFCKPILN